MLPLADGVPFYRGRCIRDGHERALSEPSLPSEAGRSRQHHGAAAPVKAR